jgi:hypothetical protein
MHHPAPCRRPLIGYSVDAGAQSDLICEGLDGAFEVGQVFVDGVHLQQADADTVEDQPVGQVAALQVGTDRVDRGLDIG